MKKIPMHGLWQIINKGFFCSFSNDNESINLPMWLRKDKQIKPNQLLQIISVCRNIQELLKNAPAAFK